MSKSNKPIPPNPEPPCCSDSSPLIPIVIIGALFILAVVLGMILFQQEKIATQRQQLQACTNHIQGLKTALHEAKANASKGRLLRVDKDEFWFEIIRYPVGFTNTPQYPAAFMLRNSHASRD